MKKINLFTPKINANRDIGAHGIKGGFKSELEAARKAKNNVTVEVEPAKNPFKDIRPGLIAANNFRAMNQLGKA